MMWTKYIAARAFLAAALTLTVVGAKPPRTLAAPPPIPANAPVKTYIVQPGDSAWSIAEEFYGRGDYYPIIYRFNDFSDKGPFLLTPGQVLRLPLLQGGPEAYVGWLHRDVRARPPRGIDWLEARERMNLWRLYRVATGDESAARIVFEDRSDLKMREKALLVIYGASATTARVGANETRRIEVEAGTVVAGLAELDGTANNAPREAMAVKTPSGQVGVLGLAIQVQVDAAVTAVSAIIGEATVSAQNETVKIPELFGTVVEKGRRPEPPKPLPPGPAWADDGQGPTIIVIDDRATHGVFRADWVPVPEAAAARVEVAADPDFKQLVHDVIVDASVEGVRLESLDVGSWWVRVASRTARGLEGRPNKARKVTVVRLEGPRLPASTEDGSRRAAGFARLALPSGLAGNHGMKILAGPHASDPGTDTPRPSIDLFRAGRHDVGIVAVPDDGAMARIVIDIEPVRAELKGLPDIWPPPGTAAAPATLHLVAPDGRPTHLPGLALTAIIAGKATPLPLVAPPAHDAAAATGWAFSLEPQEIPPEGAVLQAHWAGGPLTTHTITGPAPVMAPEPDPLGDLAPIPSHLKRGAFTPVFRDGSNTWLGVQSGVAVRNDEAHLDMTIAAQWNATNDLSLDAAFVTQELILDGPLTDTNPSSRGGDLFLGARYRFELAPDLSLSPSLRAIIGLGSGHEPRHFGAEGGLMMRWKPHDELHLDAGIAFLGVAGLAENGWESGHELRVSSMLAGTWRFLPSMEFNLSWQLLAPFDATAARADRSGSVWQVAGAGWGFDAGANIRLGASLGFGVGADTRRELGAFIGRLNLAYVFGDSNP